MARTKKFDQELAVERAQHIFWCKGFTATSVTDLLEGLRINRSSLYDTYGDKRQLYLTAVRHYISHHTELIENILVSNENAIHLIEQMLAGTVAEIVTDTEHKGCFIVNSSMELSANDPEVLKLVHENQKKRMEQFTYLMEKGQKDGSITSARTPEALARYLFHTINGLKVVGKASPDEKALLETVEMALETFRPEPVAVP